MLEAISPIDGRYQNKVSDLSSYFSEYALIKYRVKIEIEYLKSLSEQGILPHTLSVESTDLLQKIYEEFNLNDAGRVKEIEKTTNHDVKAVEYYIKENLPQGLAWIHEFVHFGLTSQDINNTAIPLSFKDGLHDVYLVTLKELMVSLESKASEYHGIPMLAHTHGQPASPTTLGKEFEVFIERINDQLSLLEDLPIKAKFGGATGNFNAHKVAFPEVNWPSFGNNFVQGIGLTRSQKTTQIAHYDHLAAIFDNMARINVILIDFCRDMWTYVSMEYFKQKIVAGEIGSSAMPHKVNPIDFENAEGNLGMANASLSHFSSKLPISRLQRDLTDSTVLRNIGVPMAHSLIAFKSIMKGIHKIEINRNKIDEELDRNWVVVGEAIQNVLRKEGFPNPYETVLALTRTNKHITKEDIHQFIDGLEVSNDLKETMKGISPFNYVGYI